MEHFNSPPAPQTDDTEDATARLIRTRDELAQQLRDRDAETRQMETEVCHHMSDRHNDLIVDGGVDQVSFAIRRSIVGFPFAVFRHLYLLTVELIRLEFE